MYRQNCPVEGLLLASDLGKSLYGPLLEIIKNLKNFQKIFDIYSRMKMRNM